MEVWESDVVTTDEMNEKCDLGMNFCSRVSSVANPDTQQA
jgi:hypothetical protein